MGSDILIKTLLDNNKKIRHDLRGSLFTLNASLIILEKNPGKLNQVTNIVKKTTDSINDMINEWKEIDEKLNKKR